MMLMLGLVVVAAVVGLVLYANSRSDDFSVERSLTIERPAAEIFPHINDFHNWAAWSPYEKLDATMTKTHGGAPSGVGATYSWSGNAKAGAGTMTINVSQPNSKVVIGLVFTKPFASSAQATFTLAPNAQGTVVTWRMDSKAPLVSKLFSLVFDMDKMMGTQFTLGLTALQARVEGGGTAMPLAKAQ